jgi:hypothetical protein
MLFSRITKAVLLIDPYWLGDHSGEPDQTIIRGVLQSAGKGVSTERVYWYLEGGRVTQALKMMLRICVRTCARDDLDDGFELN